MMTDHLVIDGQRSRPSQGSAQLDGNYLSSWLVTTNPGQRNTVPRRCDTKIAGQWRDRILGDNTKRKNVWPSVPIFDVPGRKRLPKEINGCSSSPN